MISQATQVNLYDRTFGNRKFMLPVCVILGFIFWGWLTERVDREVRTIEVTQFIYRLQELNSFVLLMNASNVAKEKQTDFTRYVGANPMAYINHEKSNVNYLGEGALSDVADIRGKWVYDPQEQVIAYRPKSMSTPEFIKNVPALSGEESSLVSVKLLHKKQAEWLRFKVVGLLSNEKKNSQTRKHTGLSLAWVH